MEEVEAASKAAVKSSHSVLNLLCKARDNEIQSSQSLVVQTQDAVLKFKRVVSLLGHGKRVKKLKNKLPSSLPQSLFLDGPNYRASDMSSRTVLQLLPPSFPETPVTQKQEVFIGNPVLDLSMKFPVQTAKPTPLQQVHGFQFQAQKFCNAEITCSRRNSAGINLAFNTPSMSSGASFRSCLSMDGGGVPNYHGGSFQLISGVPLSRSSNQISEQQQQRRSTGAEENISVKCSSSDKCPSSKKRRIRVRKSFKVPAISQNVANIPSDEYTWRKYGQKPIKGSPYPRGYYKCSSIRGCPARKHVERCLEDPSMLIVTYENEHKHSQPSQPTHQCQ